MSGFPILDLVIGMIFIYFLLSIICSSAVELWFTILKTRARLLEQWLTRIFDSPALDSHGLPVIDKNNKPITVGQTIMDHCMVTVLSGKGKATSYISADNFFSALMDKITVAPASGPNPPVQIPPRDLDEYIRAIQNSNAISGELKRTFLMLANEAKQASVAIQAIPVGSNITNNISSGIKSELDQFRSRIERWYESNADRLTGTLKRTRAVPSTIILATLITIGLNADSISIGKYLYDHKEETRQFADKAMNSLAGFESRMAEFDNNYSSPGTNDSSAIVKLDKDLEKAKKDIATIKAAVPAGLPIGWKTKTDDWLKHIAGWLVTILAICIGAPFWFDLLNKITNLRSTGPKPLPGRDDERK
jgi:hypothetical protein